MDGRAGEATALGDTARPERRLGVTVMPEYIQSEGVEAVLDVLQHRLGATVVTTSPYVARPCAPGEPGAFREPPSDAGSGAVRLLDRPLWGRVELHMRTAPSFVPDAALYPDEGYRPPAADALTEERGPVVARFLAAAKGRGMTTYLQVMAAIPPCYRVQLGRVLPGDQPMMPDGRAVPPRVDANASLAAGAVRRHLRALIRDLCARYPDCDGLRFDWPEYPPYHFLSLLADYNPQVAPFAAEIGIDLDGLARAMRSMAAEIRSWPEAPEIAALDDAEEAVRALRSRSAALDDHLRLRRHLTASYAVHLCTCVEEASGGAKRVFLQGFPPPWGLLSGFDPKAVSDHAHEVGIKFYTMHWPMIAENHARFAAEALGVSRDAAAGVASRWYLGERRPFDRLRYPRPDEPHRVPDRLIQERYQSAAAAIGPGLVGVAHAYGPDGDVARRLEALRGVARNVEINRYAYLSDEKIDLLTQTMTATSGRRSHAQTR